MESMKTDSLKCDTNAPAVEPQDDDTSPVSTKEEAFECKRHVGPVATVDSMHHGFRNDSTGLELLESAGGSEKTVLEDTVAACSSDGTTLYDDDSRTGDSPANFEMLACQQGGSMMPSKRANGFNNTITADDSCPRVCCSEQGIPALSPKGSKMEEEAAVLSCEGHEGHVAVPVSFTHVSQEVTSTVIMVSNQVESFEVAATGKPEGRKFIDANFHDLEENQLAEHAYDMDFDIDAPLEESFFDESCMFPALDADKTEAWHAGLDGVITEESSAQLHSNQHAQLVDMKSLEETDSEPVTKHELKENVASNEEWLHNSQRQAGGKTVLVDALHGLGKASHPSNKQGQGLEELASYLGNEVDSEILASGTVQDNELTCNYSKDKRAQEIQGQYDTCCTFDTLTGENVETVHAAGTCEAERLEEEVETKITLKENKNEPASIIVTHVDAAVYLHQFDGPSVVNSVTAYNNPVSNDVELHLKAGVLSEDSRLNSCSQEVIGEHQGKVIRQGSGCLDFVKNSEYDDMKSNEVNTGDQLLAKNKTSSIDSLGVPCTDDRPALILNVKTEPEHVPICSEQRSVIVCREMSTEDVSEPLAHEEAETLEQNAENDKSAANANELQYCHVESDTPYTEGAQNQSDTPVVMDRNSVKELGDCVLVARSDGVKEIRECRVETLEVINVAEQEAKTSNQDHEQSDQKSVEDFDGGVPEPSEIELKAINVGGDEILKGIVTEHETSDEELKQSDGGSVDVVDASVPQSREIESKEIDVSGDEMEESIVAEHEPLGEELKENDGGSVDVFDASVLEPSEVGLNASGDEIQEGHNAEHEPLDQESKQIAGGSVDVFDGSVPETKKREVNEIFDSGDGIIKGEVALPEQGIAFNEELEDHSSMPLAGDLSPQNRVAEELKKQELSSPEALIHLPILSDAETNVDSGANCTEKLIVLEGLKDSRNSAPVEQRAASMEQSREVRLVSSAAPAKKQSKVRSNDKLPKAELSNKSNLSTVGEAMKGDYMVDYANDECQSKRVEKNSLKEMQKHVIEGLAFGVGDVVWAKVRSHPWWPAQIFDPADASNPARMAKKSGRVLVAFFGDCTFAWLQQFQMIAFCPNFKEKVQQTTMRVFCLAVEEALEELCRRSELGLSCKHFKGSLHSTSSFPDANTGIRAGVRAERLKNIRASADMFKPKKTLDFIKNVAASPLGAWSYTLQWAESRGHAYGLRTCIVAMQGSDSPLVLLPPTVPTKGLKLKRGHSSLNAEDIREAEDDGKESQTTKKLKSDKARKDSDAKDLLAKALSGEENKQGNDMRVETSLKFSADITERNKDSNAMKVTVSKKVKSNRLSSSERRLNRQSGEEAGGERNLDDDSKETLLAIAGLSIKALKRSHTREEKVWSNSKRVRGQIDEESQDGTSMHGAVKAASLGECFSDMDVDDSLQTGAGREDIFSSPLRDGVKKTEGSKMLIETRSKREASGKDNSTGKNKSRIKLSKVGDSQGTPFAKVVDDDGGFTGAEPKKGKKELPVRQVSLMRNKVLSKKSSEDTSLSQLRWDVEPLAEKAVSGEAKGKAVQQLKKGNLAEAVAAKFSPQWQCAPHRSEKSCVQELALAARKRKSEIVHDDEVLSMLPKTSSTTSSHWEHASKAYITSAEDRGERGSYDKSLLVHSRRPAPPTSMISSSQRYDEKLSSYAPLGLFMRFPEDFPLPSEAQLKATFIPFGPLQMSATRIYKDSTSAQVVFKHGRDAESALKHAKKNPMFGQVAVTYRLRHLSTRVETKGDTPSPIKAHPTQAAAVKESASSMKKLGGLIGDKELLSSVMLRPRNLDGQSGSEPTGDIQDQLMTLLQQVSVIVNTSPVM